MNIKAIAKEVLEFLVYLIIMVAAVFALRHFVVESFRVDGHSMDYTLQHDERLFMWKLAKIERFDVVVIKAPSDPSKRYIKRVIGVPGDTIEVRDDKLYLNGVATDEPYLAEKVKEYQELVQCQKVSTSSWGITVRTRWTVVPLALLMPTRSKGKPMSAIGL